MSEKSWCLVLALMVIIMLTTITINGVLNITKQNKDNKQGVITYEITTNDDEKIIDRATDYKIDEMGNLSLELNNIKIGSYSYGCWTKIVEVENVPKTN